MIVTTGVGQHQVWVPRHFDFDAPERVLLTSSGHGTMGFDLPAAIGAKIADPDATVICFVGDGSLQMNIQELATIVERKLDIKIVVLDNHALQHRGAVPAPELEIASLHRRQIQSRFRRASPQAYGMPASSIASSDGMTRQDCAPRSNRKGPVLIHCQIDPAGRSAADAAGRPHPGRHVQRIVVLTWHASGKLALVTGAGSGIGKAIGPGAAGGGLSRGLRL